MPSPNVDLQALVDHLIAAEKTTAGRADWKPTDYEGQWRWVRALEIDGEGTGMTLMVDAWPSSSIPKFTITLNFTHCVSRIDASPHERHNNHKVKGKYFPYEISEGWIFGPHFHTWQLNRHLATPNSLPRELEFAMNLPGNLQGFENTFRCFCGQNNIECLKHMPPSLPDKDYLI